MILLLVFSTMPASLAENTHEVLEQRIASDIYKVWTITFNEALDPSTVNDTTVSVKNSFNRSLGVTVSLSADGKSISVTPDQMYVPELEYVLYIENVASLENEVLSPGIKMPFIIEEVKEERQRNRTTSPVPSTRTEQQPKQATNQANSNPAPTNNSSSRPATNQPATAPSTKQQSTNSTQRQTEQKPVHLTNIKVDVNSMVSNITVRTSNFVAVVKVNGRNMHYQGNNVYELAVPGVKRGDNIKIEAFSSYERGSLIETINHNVK